MVEIDQIQQSVDKLHLESSEASYGSGQGPAAGGIPQFGKSFGKKYFPFNQDVINVNHGSYGTVPKSVVNAKFQYLQNAYGYPENHFKLLIEDKVNEIRREVAEVIDANSKNLVFATNDTTAVNTVLRSYPFKRGDKVIYSNIGFSNCVSSLKYLKDIIGIELIQVEILYPMNNDEVVDVFTNAMDSNDNVKMVLLDTVTSVPAALLPWERLCKECRKRDILSLVDGAHGIGLIPISLHEAKPDFFTSNLHKWFYTPVSLALLYVDSKHHDVIYPLNIPPGYVTKEEQETKAPIEFAERFFENGTIDYSNIQSIEDAIKFRNDICGGEERIRNYCYNLAIEAGNYMSKEFNTTVLSGKEDRISTSMINVKVPFDAPSSKQSEVFNKFTSYICNKHKTFVPIFYYNDSWWVRLSAQVYLDLDDFKYATKAILDTLEYLKSDIK